MAYLPCRLDRFAAAALAAASLGAGADAGSAHRVLRAGRRSSRRRRPIAPDRCDSSQRTNRRTGRHERLSSERTPWHGAFAGRPIRHSSPTRERECRLRYGDRGRRSSPAIRCRRRRARRCASRASIAIRRRRSSWAWRRRAIPRDPVAHDRAGFRRRGTAWCASSISTPSGTLTPESADRACRPPRAARVSGRDRHRAGWSQRLRCRQSRRRSRRDRRRIAFGRAHRCRPAIFRSYVRRRAPRR